MTSAPESSSGRSTLHRAVRAVRAYAREAVGRANAARSQHATIDASFVAVDRDRRIAAGVLAGGIAFRLFLWTLPLALIAAGVLGLLDASVTDDAVESLGVSAAAAASVEEAAADAAGSSWWLIVAGSLLLVLAGTAAVRALELVHGAACAIPPRRARGLKSGLVFSAIGIGIVVTHALLAWAREAFDLDRSLFVLIAAVMFCVWLLGSRWVFPYDAPLRALLPGAILVGLGTAVMEALSVYVLVPVLTKKSEVYGALGIAAAMLIWLYVLGRLIVASAIVDAALWERRMRGAADAVEGS